MFVQLPDMIDVLIIFINKRYNLTYKRTVTAGSYHYTRFHNEILRTCSQYILSNSGNKEML